MTLSRTMSRGWWRLFAITGPVLFVLLYLGIRLGFSVAVGIAVAIISVGISVAIGCYVRRIPPTRTLDVGRQSWAFMFGDPFCLAPILALTASAWGSGYISSIFAEWWWVVDLTFCGIVAGAMMSHIDRKRYDRNNALAAYDQPDKQWHDKVVVWVVAALLAVATVPVLLTSCPQRPWILGLFAVYAALLGIDELRKVDPRWQYGLDEQ